MRMTKKNFEIELFKHFRAATNNGENIGKEIVKERIAKNDKLVYVTITVYYLNDLHVATWSNGKGHIFDESLIKLLN